MHIPRWKKWLSYLTEIHVESTSSEYNEGLHVSISQGRYQLCTDNAIYSFADKYSNFKDVFDQINWSKLPGQEVLILGFGLGSIPWMLEHNFKQSLFYTGVEIDEAVVELAEKYGTDTLKSPIDIIIGDAFAFLYAGDEPYDMICMDVFEDQTIPADFLEDEFLEVVLHRLSPNGLFIFNRLANTTEELAIARHYFDTTFLPIFPKGKALHTGGNLMLINDTQYLIHPSA